MAHQHTNLLRSILHEAPGANIHWREVESMLRHLGTQVEPSHGARFKVTLNGVTDFLHHPHHGSVCSREMIKHLRDFLTHAGATVPGAGSASDDKGTPQATG